MTLTEIAKGFFSENRSYITSTPVQPEDIQSWANLYAKPISLQDAVNINSCWNGTSIDLEELAQIDEEKEAFWKGRFWVEFYYLWSKELPDIEDDTKADRPWGEPWSWEPLFEIGGDPETQALKWFEKNKNNIVRQEVMS